MTDEFPTVDGENKEGEKKDEKKEDKKEDNAKKEEEERKEKEAEAERKRKEDKEHRKNAKRDSDGPKMTGKEAASKKDPNVRLFGIVLFRTIYTEIFDSLDLT